MSNIIVLLDSVCVDSFSQGIYKWEHFVGLLFVIEFDQLVIHLSRKARSLHAGRNMCLGCFIS